MNKGSLRQRVDRFCAWYKLVRTWDFLQTSVFLAVSFVALWIVVDKFVYLGLDYSLVGLAAGVVCLAAVLVAYLAMPRHRGYVSYLIDQKAGFKNLVASALEQEEQQDEVSQVVVERAHAAIGGQAPHSLMPFKLRRPAQYAVAPLLVAVLVGLFVPQFDLFERHAAAQQKAAEKQALQESAMKLQETQAKLEKKAEKVKSISGKNITKDLQALQQEMPKLSKKEAIEKLAALENKYQKEFGERQSFESMTKSMSTQIDNENLAMESQETLKDLLDSLKKGDYETAAQKMREAAEQMQGDELTEAQKQALAEQMKKLMEDMTGKEAQPQQNAKNQKSGTQQQNQQQNGQQNNGQKNAQNQQNQDGQKGAQQNQNGQKSAQQNNQQNAQQSQDQQQQALNQMAKAMQQMQSSKAGKEGKKQACESCAGSMNQMADQLDAMQGMKGMQEGLADAKKEMLGDQAMGFNAQEIEKYMRDDNMKGAGLGQKPGQGNQPGQQPGIGGGTGGPGQGRGGLPPEQKTATNTKDERDIGEVGEGQVISQMMVSGVPEKGEASEEYVNAARAAQQEATSSLARNKVPREYEQMVKGYFDGIERMPEDE